MSINVPSGIVTVSGLSTVNAMPVAVWGASGTQSVGFTLGLDGKIGINIFVVSGSVISTSGGATSLRQTTINFGTTIGTLDAQTFTIADTTVTSGAKISAELAYVAASGRDLDELEMDSIDLKAGQTTSGQFTLMAQPLEGSVTDGYVVNYLVA